MIVQRRAPHVIPAQQEGATEKIDAGLRADLADGAERRAGAAPRRSRPHDPMCCFTCLWGSA